MYTDTETHLVEGSNMLLALDDLVALALGRIDNAPVDQKPLPPLLTHFERILSRLYVCACTDTDRDADTDTETYKINPKESEAKQRVQSRWTLVATRVPRQATSNTQPK